MVIHSPIFSGSIIQDRNNAYADLSGSFTGSLTGSFKGQIDVQQATFDNLIVRQTLTLGSNVDNKQRITGSIETSGSMVSTGSINLTQGAFLQDGVNVLDTALAYSIALG
jgi:hypothetical protein